MLDLSNAPTYDISNFVIPPHYQDSVASILIPRGMILDRIEKMSHELAADNIDIAVCVLKGANETFAALTYQLMKRQVSFKTEYIKVSSYHGTNSTGKAEISLSEKELMKFKGKDILLVEDIVDTGSSMVQLLEVLKQYNPNSVKVCSLLLKRTPQSNEYVPDVVGFKIPDKFVIGFGMDYNQNFRDFEHLGIINDHGINKFANN